MSPENVLVSHRTHHLIIDVQPSFATTIATSPRAAVAVRVKYIKCIVSAACRHAVVVEHTIERVARGLRRRSGSRCHDICTARYSQPRHKEEKKTRTKWDFELWRELDRFADLDYATRGRIVQEAFEVKDEHGWKRLDQHLLARLARARRANLHGLRLRDVSECVLNCVYRVGLCKEFASLVIRVYEWVDEENKRSNEPGCRVGVIASLRQRQSRAGVACAGSNETFHQIFV